MISECAAVSVMDACEAESIKHAAGRLDGPSLHVSSRVSPRKRIGMDVSPAPVFLKEMAALKY